MKKLLQSLFLMLFVAVSAMAQQRTITGTVTGKDDGLPLPGVSVRIKGSSTGTSTGADGKFSIQIPSSETPLVFSSIGYTTIERAAGNAAVLNISLGSDENQLGEVVVTALGVTRTK